MLDLAFRPDATLPEPVYRQLADHLAELIAAGRLARGERVPPSRELAASLGIARNTVTRAYEWLAGAGWLGAHVGRGSFVLGPPRRHDGVRGASSRPLALVPPAFAWSALFSARVRSLDPARVLRAPAREVVRCDLRPGRVDPSLLPIAELQGAWQRAVGQLRAHGNDFDPLGWPPLRAAIARSLAGRGIAKSADEVLVTAGAQQALDLVARVLIDPGDVVAVEDPSYLLAMLAFRAAGAQLVGIGVDAEGLRVDELERVLRTRRVKLCYVTPSSQVPTGVVLSSDRRVALLEIADRAQLPILEDDYDCELRSDAALEPALAAQGGGDRVVYTGTFSKALFPGLRVGYVVGAPPLLRALSLARVAATFQPSLVDQIALAELLAHDTLERHVRRVRKRYAERRHALAEALTEHMPAGAQFREPRGGTTIWLELPREVDRAALEAAATASGIAYGPGDAFRVEGEGPPALCLSAATLAPDSIRAGIAELGALVRRSMARRPQRGARRMS